MLPTQSENARLVGRVWRADINSPAVVLLRDNQLIDITTSYPTMSDFLDADAVHLFDTLEGEAIGTPDDFLLSPEEMGPRSTKNSLLAPCDLQALKACGVTFAQSMIERVIDERTSGDASKAEEIRQYISKLIGGSLSNIQAGSKEAMAVKEALVKEGLWSQYLEVGIGPDAEVFTKSQTLSAVGHGAQIGINPISEWNNPEPEVVLAIDSRGAIKGATLGNDVNLRDIEGRSALLLGKAKDNNASCAIGPFIRLLDEHFTINHIENLTISMSVQGLDQFVMSGQSNMAEISRKPENLVEQTFNDCHQYPDGVMLFLGTMFAPTQDREEKGSGFTHKIGDVVKISTDLLGTLTNTVTHSNLARPWEYGIRAFMQDLKKRGVL